MWDKGCKDIVCTGVGALQIAGFRASVSERARPFLRLMGDSARAKQAKIKGRHEPVASRFYGSIPSWRLCIGSRVLIALPLCLASRVHMSCAWQDDRHLHGVPATTLVEAKHPAFCYWDHKERLKLGSFQEFVRHDMVRSDYFLFCIWILARTVQAVEIHDQ